jgi:TP901 family phage tail tape measure protein
MAGKYSTETVFKAIDKMSSPIDRMERRIMGFSNRVGKRLQTMGAAPSALLGGLAALGSAAAVAAVPLGLVAKNITDIGSGYEQAITNVGAVMLKSRSEIAELDVEAKRLGATTKFTATQAAQGMELMARAGFSTADILAGMTGVLSAAAAEGTELAEVANHVSNVLKGMNLSADQASRVADVLALASSKTNSSLSSLGESMSNVSSTARELGVPLEAAVASVALLQDVGLDASVAGSALNTMLTRLAAPTDALKAQMRAMGVAFADSSGNALPFIEILKNLAKGGNKAGGNMDKVAFFAELVGLRGQKAASNLAAMFDIVDKTTGKNKVEDLVEALQNAEGAAGKMAAIRIDTTQGDWLLMTSAIDAVKVSLFEAQSGPLRGMIQGTTKWVEANKGLIQTKVAEYIQKIGDNMPAIVTWGTRIGKVVLVLMAWSTAIKVCTFANLVLSSSVSTVAAVVGIYSGVVKAITYLQGAWQIANYLTAGSLTAVAVAAGSVLIAVGAVTLAIREFTKLLDVIEGYDVWELFKDFALGDAAFGFQKLDDYQNKKAKERAKQREESSANSMAYKEAKRAPSDATVLIELNNMLAKNGLDPVGPGADYKKKRDGDAEAPATVASAVDLSGIQLPPQKIVTSGEITIKDETGRAKITKAPPPGGVPLKLKPSGAF